MLKYLIAASMVATAEAADCSTLTQSDNQCNLGQRLADIDTITECKDTICANLIGIYSIAHGSDMTKKIVGQSYGCQIEDWDGTNVGEVICMPNSGPAPGPDPTNPPGPGPNPGPEPSPPTPGDSSGGSDGIDGGAIFLIIFFVGFAVYFAAGMAYQYKVKGATGVEMIPNLEFWKDLPNLMKDGVFFIKNKVTGGGYSSV